MSKSNEKQPSDSAKTNSGDGVDCRPMSGSANELSSKCAASIDGIIAEAIREQLGETPPLEILKGRLQRTRFQGDEFETLHLDGHPILELHPLEITTKRDGDSVKMIATQPYRTFKQNGGAVEPEKKL